MRNYSSISILLLISTQAFGFYQDYERGWYYFERNNKPSYTQEFDVHTQLEGLQKELEYHKAKLVLYPTIENARKYMKYQQEVFEKASKVSQVWQAALLKYPDLDSRITNPVSEQAIRIKHSEDDRHNDVKIMEFAKNFELIFFYKNDCSYCQEFSPIINQFSTKYGFKIRAVSPEQELARKLKVEVTPTLFAYNHQNNIYLPVARGFATDEELKRNINLIYNNIVILAHEN